MAKTQNPSRFILSLVFLGVVAIVLLSGRVVASDSSRYAFLLWNLVLASIAPLVAWWLVQRVREHGWLHWQQFALSALWFVFLPNSFYLITDLVHLRSNYEASLIYDTILLQSFVLAGLVFGYTSVYLVHKELQKRVKPMNAWLVIGAVFFASSFAIYLGRFTRWNTWDILLKPAGLLFDVSDRFINPGEHGDTYLTTFTFFVVLMSVYMVIWQASQLIKHKQ